jgi:predicted nucleic acid-binding protein
LYPHTPRWFAECVALMRETAGAVTFHDALLCVAAGEVGYGAIVSFDAGFDGLERLRRIASAGDAESWVE